MEEEVREFITPEIEKRRQRRVKLVAQVKCDALGRNEILVSRDVSAGGMFVTTKTPLPLDSLVSVSFNLGTGVPVLSCNGKVVCSMPGMGMGIEFVELSDETRHSLEKFVDEAL